MPAAAVIPAPIAYIKVVAVKKLVVGYVDDLEVRIFVGTIEIVHPWVESVWHRLSCRGCPSFTVKKLECSKQAYAAEYISME